MQGRLLIAALAAAAVLAACGSDGSDESTTSTTDTTTSIETTTTGETPPDAGGDPFREEWASLCEDFYADAGTLQQELAQLAVTEQSSRKEKQEGVDLVEDIQARSDEFIQGIKDAPLPKDKSARKDAEAAIESLDEFRRIQEQFFDGFADALLTGEGADEAEQQLPQIRKALDSELKKQQMLLTRLDLPECVTPTGM